MGKDSLVIWPWANHFLSPFTETFFMILKLQSASELPGKTFRMQIPRLSPRYCLHKSWVGPRDLFYSVSCMPMIPIPHLRNTEGNGPSSLLRHSMTKVIWTPFCLGKGSGWEEGFYITWNRREEETGRTVRRFCSAQGGQSRPKRNTRRTHLPKFPHPQQSWAFLTPLDVHFPWLLSKQ